MENIKILDLGKQYKRIKNRVDKKILAVVASQRFILGEETEQFERAFAKYCGKKYAVALGSGTDALYVALSAMGFQQGDEVIVPVYTFISPAEVVSILGGKVVFCDVHPHTGLMDADCLERCLTRKTRFIIPVHLYGQLVPMDRVMEIASKKNIQIIEDAAQAHGATYKNTMAPLSNVAIYSFYPAKNLGAYGDAGAMVTDSKRLYEQAVLMRNHGQRIGEKYYHRSIGFNFRMDELQAAVLNVKLRYLDRWVQQRRALASLYDRELRSVNDIEILRTVSSNIHAYHLYCVKGKQRDALLSYLRERGVETRVHYPTPLHLQPAFRYLGYNRGDFPGAEELSKEILCLPLYPELNKKEVLYVTKTIQTFFKQSK